MASISSDHRRKGNEFYASASKDGLQAALRVERYNQAANCYYRALQTSVNDDEKASACKNLGTSYYKQAIANCAIGQADTVAFQYHEALTYLCKSHLAGSKVKSKSWMDNVEQTLTSVIQAGLGFFSTLSHLNRIKEIEKFITCCHLDYLKAELFTKVAQLVFLHGVAAIQDGDYKGGLNAMHKCYTPIQEARRLARGKEGLLTELQTIEEDVHLNKCIAESVQARVTADSLLDQLINNEERINMTFVLETMDWYRKAILLAREKEIENEAIALSQIGYIYDKVLKMKMKAHDAFMRCIQLANSLSPREFHSQKWYQHCTEALERYQAEQTQRDDEAKQKQREPYLAKLKPDLDKLKEQQAKGHESFIRFVYKTHPPKPKKGEASLDEKSLEEKKFKKAFLKAVTHYHPDQQKETDGQEWAILCEEITKMFTAIYEMYKL